MTTISSLGYVSVFDSCHFSKKPLLTILVCAKYLYLYQCCVMRYCYNEIVHNATRKSIVGSQEYNVGE